MREMTALAWYITLPFVGHTPPFNFFKGGKQGGVETPDEWRAIIDQIMEPIVLSWCQRGLGFTLDMTESASRLINHAVWADNIVFFAADYAMMQCMILELNEAFGTFCNPDGHRYFQWKPDSLEYIVSDPQQELKSVPLILEEEGNMFEYKGKDLVRLLGTTLDSEGSTYTSLTCSTGNADGHYFKHQQILRNRALPLGKRLRAWHDSTAAIDIFDSGTWHVSAGVLRELRTWELQKLRMMLRLQRRPEEGQFQYNVRTASQISNWYRKNGLEMAYGRVLKSVFTAAWREVA
jgi:hypothetical protein